MSRQIMKRWPRLSVNTCISIAAIFFSISLRSEAQQLGDSFTLSSTGSCPAFHCDAEGTGLMQHALPLARHGLSVAAANLLPHPCGGKGQDACEIPGFQSCSSDDTNAVCLFQDGPSALLSINIGSQSSPTQNFALAGDVATNNPSASKTAAVLDEKSGSGAVALIGQDHSVIVADGNWVKRLKSDGTQIWPTSSSPAGVGDVGKLLGYPTTTGGQQRAVAGITPLQYNGETIVAVTYNDGPIANPNTYSNIVAFNLTDGTPIAKFPVTTTNSSTGGLAVGDVSYATASPPVGHGNKLYFVGYDSASDLGLLASLDLSDGAFTMSHHQTFGGITGASPLYTDAAKYTAFVSDQILLHVPDPMRGTLADLNCTFDGTPDKNDHLVSFSADLSKCNWAAALNPNANPFKSSGIQVGPALDPVSGGVWLWTSSARNPAGQKLYHYPATGGHYDRVIDLPTICEAASADCGLAPRFVGHIYAVNPAGARTVYIVTLISGMAGTGSTKSVIAIDTTARIKTSSVIKWSAPISHMSGASYGGALPLVTLPGNAGAGVIFSGGTASLSSGNVSLVKP